MSDNPYMPDNPYMNIGKQTSNPYMDLRKKRVPAEKMAENMMSQMVGLDRPKPIPFEQTHPTLWAAGKTAMDMPGLIEKAAMSVVSGATFSLPERAEEAGRGLTRILFGEGRKGGATGSWTEKPELHPYLEKGLRFGGQVLTISALGKTVAAPIINAVMKHRHLAPFARMIGWGAAGTTYEAGERMLSEGELPTPQELLKSGGTWAAIEGVISSLGWTGKLAVGLNRLSKVWTIPKKEVLKSIIKESKVRGIPLADYMFVKAKVQKALSPKDVTVAKGFVGMVDNLMTPFKKQGTYQDLVNQLKRKEISSRIRLFEQAVKKATAKPVKVVAPTPKPKLTKILTEDLPDWVRKTGDDIRFGTPVSKDTIRRYQHYFATKRKTSTTIPYPTKVSKHVVKPAPSLGGGFPKKHLKHTKTPTKRPRGDIDEFIPEDAWRAETGYKHQKGRSAAAVVRYEQKELGNKLGVSVAKMKELEAYPVTNIKWVATTKKGATRYGDPEKVKFGKNIEVIAQDGEGGFLILDKTLEAIKAKGAALKFPDGTIVTGQTHAVAYQKALSRGLEKQLDKGFDEGFVTTSNRFITRDQAQVLYKANETNALLKKGIIATGKPKAKVQEIKELRWIDKAGEPGVKEQVWVNVTKEHTPKGTTLGFGPTGALQNIYEKLMAGRLHKPLKKKVGDAVSHKLTPDAQLVMDALKKIKPLSKKQKEIYSIERGKRLTAAIKLRGTTSGEHGYHTELKALEGSMEYLEFEPVRKLVTQKTVNNLMNEIKDCPILSNWEAYPARKALAQILQGSMPTEGGQRLLRDVFGKKFVDAISSNKALWKKIKEAGITAINFPKAIKSSYDLSAPLRQGIFMLRRYRQWLPAFRDMFKYFGSKEAYHEGTLSIRRHHNYKLAKDHKLALTDLGSITSREEAFMSSWAEKIPGVGASARAYTGFLNQLRFDVFNDFVKKGQRLGLLKNEKYLKTAAKYINHATGRGHLMGLEGAATELNAVFFSPRLIMSRLQLVNPVFYVKLEKHVRKEALKDLFAITGLTCSVGGLAKMAGLDVEIDPRSADFMKIKVGNKRFDTLGGLQQTIRTVAQFITGEVISTTTGKTLTLGEGYKPMTRLGVAGRFLQYKLAPVSSFAVTLLTGQATMGGKLDIPTEIGRLFSPMAAQDMYELYDDEGLSAIPLAVPAFFGVGLQTYGGVSTYGLSGKDYRTLNTELSRLKTSLGFPSTSVYGQELTNKEYKVFKNKAGKEIARSVENIMKASFYKKANDDGKRHIVDKVIDHTKEKVRRELFRKYMLVQQRATAIRKATYKPVQESRKMAKEQVEQIMKRK